MSNKEQWETAVITFTIKALVRIKKKRHFSHTISRKDYFPSGMTHQVNDLVQQTMWVST